MSHPIFLECIECAARQPYERFVTPVCKDCGAHWLEPGDEDEAFKRDVLRGLPGRPLDLWRYQDLLPLEKFGGAVLYPVGGTPLWASRPGDYLHWVGRGLAQARQRIPGLNVTDLRMPGMDGFGLVEDLRPDPHTRAIPIVVISAKDSAPEERKRLDGHIEARYQRGSLPPSGFVDQLILVIEENHDV